MGDYISSLRSDDTPAEPVPSVPERTAGARQWNQETEQPVEERTSHLPKETENPHIQRNQETTGVGETEMAVEERTCYPPKGTENPQIQRLLSDSSDDIDPAAAELAFRIERPSLLIAIDSTLELSNFLYSKGAISREVRNKLSVISLSQDEKNMLLMNEVEDKIVTNSTVFQTFITALESQPHLEEMATRLLDSYRKVIGSAPATGSTPDSYPGPLGRYACYLRAYYNTSPISQDFKWPLTPSTQYITLAIIKKEFTTRSEADEFTRLTFHGDIDEIPQIKKQISMEDVLKPCGSEKLRFVLVEGPPGVGKSTFAWELCKRWDEIEALRQYSLVVLLRLRDVEVQKATSLSDIFHHEDSSLQQAVVQEVREKEGQGVLLIFDGADEYPASLRRDRGSLILQIISGYCLPKATVLVTSRPSATRDLVTRLTPQKHVEIVGFTKDKIAQYAKSVFQSEPDQLTSFMRYISSSPSIRGMLYIPLNNAIVVQVYRENMAKNKPIPTTLTQLYDDLSCILLQRYMLSAGLVEEELPNAIEDFPREILTPFHALVEVAYKGTIEQQLVFSRLPEGSKVLGFTTASPELYTGRRLSHNFLHRTIQEYLTAIYISQLPLEKQKELFLALSSLDHLDVVWRFIAGMTGFKGIGWELIRSEKGRERKKYSLGGRGGLSTFILQCLYEAQNQADFAAVLGSGEIAYGKRHNMLGTPPQLTIFNCFVLGYCIAHSKCTWKLYLYHQRLGPELVEMLTLGMKSQDEVSSTIDTLHLAGSYIDQEGVAFLKEMPLLGEICELSLVHCNLDGALLDLLACDIIPVMCSLELLDISDNPVTSGGTVKLLQALTKSPSLQFLSLALPELGARDLQAVGELIAPSTGTSSILKELRVGTRIEVEEMIVSMTAMQLLQFPFVEAGAVQELVSRVSVSSSLQKLQLINADMQSSMSTLGALLEKNSNPNLRSLTLHCCQTGGPSGAKSLAGALCKNTTLEVLIILSPVCSKIGDEGAVAFSEMLKVNRSLKILALLNPSDIEKDGFTALVDALKHNQTLEMLELNGSYFRATASDPRVEWNFSAEYIP